MSGRDLHERATALFLEVRHLPNAQREHRLRQATEGKDMLRLEVQSLLEHDTIGGQTTTLEAGPAASAQLAATGATSETPERIGPYRVVQRIGRGGSGFVLLAEQDEPVRRRVAIKIVPHAALDPDFAARFEFERRALERTEHPNIARILDAGRTHDGLPYLVMDYVEGAPITEYCRRHVLGLRGRIELMLQVADAVQHAHQRGVIHRDLKPANIIVTEISGRATPRVLDFGIAKPIPEMFGSDSPPTVGMPLGTPAYMAPEQAGLQPVDTRADVYALGAVLYELTCGRSPNALHGDAVESLRRIREAVPPPASRVRRQHMRRGLDAAAVDSPPTSMLSDLDCILAKALEKDPGRRYPAASVFAMDLQRLLRSEPIEARPATRRYRTARFVQRNRVLVGACALALLALVAGIVGLSLGLVEARQQRREAMNQTESQREINRFLTGLLGSASPDQQGQNVTALDLLHQASDQVDSRFPAQPLVAASIHHTLGVSYTALGAFDDAERHLQQAIRLRTAATGADAPDTVRAEIAAASLLGQRQRLEEASQALTQAIKRARLILGANDPALYAALNDLGSVREGQDRAQEAIALLQEALTGRIRLLGPSDPLVLASMSNLSQAYDRAGKTDESLAMLLDALRVAESLPQPPRMPLLELNNNIGATYQDLNRDRDAEPYVRKAAALAADYLGPEHPATLTIEANLAGIESELGDPEAAATLLNRIVEVRTRTLGADAHDTLTGRYAYWNVLWKAKRFNDAASGLAILLQDVDRALGEKHWLAAATRTMLARALVDGGQPQQALPYATQAAAQFTALYGADHPRAKTAIELTQQITRTLSPATEAALAGTSAADPTGPQ